MISIIVPIYNEEKAIRNTLERLKKIGPKLGDFEIIAVNDGSSDNTRSTLESIDGITVVNSPYNLGYGASIKKGMRACRGNWIAITDADGTYPLEELPTLAKYAGEYDMVVGARTGKSVHIPFFRKPAKWIIGRLANFMAGRKIDDVNSGLRIFNKAKALEFMKLYPSGFSFTTTITLAFMTNEYTVKYIPINYFKRTGKSSIKPLKDFIGFIALIFRIVMYFRPLRFFLWPAAVLIIAGIIHGTYQIIHFPTGLGDVPVFLLIVGVQTILMGFIADVVSKK
ncbi:MAG TPA: glycosyltransferase family 2 protein [Candidatus Nanoarchaeia archaeon]|nr:glycosyltransferase family 2 protein [Candidatus Nanoarchaeia archaeon]